MTQSTVDCDSTPSTRMYCESTSNRAERFESRGRTIDREHFHRSAPPISAHTKPKLTPRSLSRNSSDDGTPVNLLLIDDEPSLMVEQLTVMFSAPEHRLHVASTGKIGIEFVITKTPDVIFLALDLCEACGFEIYQQIRRFDVNIPVIVLTKTQRSDAVIESTRLGAFDCLFKPVDQSVLRRVVNEALDVARFSPQDYASVEDPMSVELDLSDVDGDIIGCCSSMQEAYKAIGRVADQKFPVLITGESGTGKEVVARALYQHGSRAEEPFLAINCAAIPEHLLESELFGHEKGAFTGADRRRIGKFEQCHGGTLFLDEIGDMPLPLQAKILRLLQEQMFERIGGNETIRTDVRLIAATHRNLKAWAEEGKFRADLYYRLSVFNIHLPALRERGNDIPLLIQYYLRRFNRELRRGVCRVAPETMTRLCEYPWPGNIRELQSVLKQTLLQASGTVLLPAFLPEPLAGTGRLSSPIQPVAEPGMETFIVQQRVASDVRDLYAETHRQIDRLMLSRVLEYTRGNLQRAALLLGIARQTLRIKLRELGLYTARTPEADEEMPE